MIPIRLNMHNFLAYRAPQPVLLEDVRLACLIGANGAGKSSLLDAVTWALWGKARTRRDNDLIYMGASDMYVELDFLHEGQKYRVVRQRQKRGASGSGKLYLYVYDGDALNEMSEASANATQARINGLLRLDYDTFINSAFLKQGSADLFTTQQPARRKQILSNILGLEAWAQYEDNAKKLRDENGNQVKALDIRIADYDKELATEPAIQRDLAEAQAAHDTAKNLLGIAEQQLAELKDAPALLDAAKNKHADRAHRLTMQEKSLDAIHATLERNEQQLAEYQSVLDMRTEIEQGYEALQAARSARDDLSDKLSQLQPIDAQISDRQSEIRAERTRLETERDGLQNEIAALEQQIAGVSEDEIDRVTAQLDELKAKEAERDTAQERLNTWKNEFAGLKGTNDALKLGMNELKERIDDLEQVEGASCPLCGQPLDETHRVELLAELNAEGKTRGDTYRANAARMDEIDAEQKALAVSLKTLKDAVAELPRLRERAGELQAKRKAAADAQRTLKDRQQRLDEVTRTLTEEDYAQPIREQLVMLQAEKDALGYDGDAYKAHSAAMQQYSEYENMQASLRVAEQTVPGLLERREEAQRREAELHEMIAELNTELTDIDGEIARLTVQVEEFDRREQEERRLSTEERNKWEAVNNAQQALRALESLRDRKARDIDRRKHYSEQRGIYEELVKAFGKNGVPAMIIETAIPELQTITNDLLMRMTDGRMTVKFDTQREKVSGGTTETLDITIADELGTRGYEMYSGGEAFRINFAIRVALSKLLARRAGAHLETLFIDEGFGTQ
ncbi:MAG: SMC family ATPase, partial [Chloroflexota bacterium]